MSGIMLSLMTRPQVAGWYGITSQLFQTLMFLPVLLFYGSYNLDTVQLRADAIEDAVSALGDVGDA